MTVEGALVVALSVASTAAAGLASAAAPRPPEGERGVARRSAIFAVNLFVLPAAAWVGARAFHLGEAGLGLVVAAAAPGGSTGPLLASLAGGDPRVAARWFFTLTVAGTLTAVAVTMLLAPGDLVGFARAVGLVLATSLLPLLAAQAIARRAPRHVARPRAFLSRASVLLLVALIGLLAVKHGARASAGPVLMGAGLVVVTSSLGLVAGGARALRIAVAQVSTVRNLTLALLVLRAIDAPAEATVAVLGYGLVMYAGAGSIAAWTRYAAPT